MTNPSPVLLRLTAVARRLSCSRKEVYSLIREGRLPAHRIGEGQYRIMESDLAGYLERGGRDITKGEINIDPPAPSAPQVRHELPSKNEEGTVTINLPIPPELDPERAATVMPTVPPADIFTVAYLIEQWLDEVRGRVRPKTYLSYEQMTRIHILPVLGPWQVERLDIRTIEKFLQWKYQSGLSARSVQYLRALLRQAYNEAIRWGWLSRNVPALARGPKSEHSQISVPSIEEACRLLASFEHLRHGPIFIIALGLGLRLGEVLGLRWCDVCLPNPKESGDLGQITIRVQLQYIDNQYELVSPKSRTSIRSLSLPSFVAHALIKRRDAQREERMATGSRWQNEFGLVFTNLHGGPLDERRVRQRFSEHLIRHGFAHMRIHDLRHFCASLLLAEGIHPRVLMEILGHSQISLTMNTYCHVMKSAHPEAARLMERAVRIRSEDK